MHTRLIGIFAQRYGVNITYANDTQLYEWIKFFISIEEFRTLHFCYSAVDD